MDGVREPFPPSITLSAEDFVAALKAFRDDTRQGTVMNRIAKGLDDAEINAAAAYYAVTPTGALKCRNCSCKPLFPTVASASRTLGHVTRHVGEHRFPRMRARSMNALTRRQFLGLGVHWARHLAGRSTWPQTPTRVVVVGGGFGGATCAKYMRRADATHRGHTGQPHRQFVTCPFSNAVLVGLRDLAAVTHGYDALRQRHGVRVVHAAATALDPTARRVTLDDGSTLAYDRLVLAPGIELRWGAIEGYDAAASEVFPHAWEAGAQTLLLRRQLEAMEDGGLVLMPLRTSRIAARQVRTSAPV